MSKTQQNLYPQLNTMPQSNAPPAYHVGAAVQQVPQPTAPVIIQQQPQQAPAQPFIINNVVGGQNREPVIQGKILSRTCGCNSITFWTMLLGFIIMIDVISTIRHLEYYLETKNSYYTNYDLFGNLPFGRIIEAVLCILVILGFYLKVPKFLFTMIFFWAFQMILRILAIIAGCLYLGGADSIASYIFYGISFLEVGTTWNGIELADQSETDDAGDVVYLVASSLAVVGGLFWNGFCVFIFGMLAKSLN